MLLDQGKVIGNHTPVTIEQDDRGTHRCALLLHIRHGAVAETTSALEELLLSVGKDALIPHFAFEGAGELIIGGLKIPALAGSASSLKRLCRR